MNTDNGALEFDAYINNQRLFTSAAEAERRIKGVADSAVREGEKVENAFSKIGPLIAGYFGFEAMKSFTSELVRVRGEFQKYEAVLTNTFGSNEKAVKSMTMLTEIAAKTPFQLDAITDSYIKLVNQGFEPTREQIIALGDLASSTGKGFDQLVEAILDAQNGEFERLKEFGIKASVEGDKVRMSFKGVTTEIDKSSESIRNYILGLGDMQGVAGSMEAISGTLVGQISNLQDTWSRMLNDIGTQNEGLISDIISGTSYVIEHYQDILDILMPIVATYGAYKAALIAMATAQKAAAAATFVQEYLAMGKALGFATANQIAFNKATLANPYALAAAAIVGLSIAVYKLATNTTAAEKAQKELDEAIESETLTLEIMFDRLKNAKQGTQEYADAKQAIIDKYGQYDAALQSELETVEGMKIAYDKLTDAVIASSKARLRDKYTKEASDEAADDISGYYSNIRDKLIDKLGKQAGSALFDSVKAAFETGDNWKDVLNKQGISTEDIVIQGQYGPSYYENYFGKQFRLIEKEKTRLKASLAEFDAIFGDINKKQQESGAGNDGAAAAVALKNKEYWEKQKKSATEAIAAMEDTEKGSEAWNAQIKLIDEAERHLDAYDLKKKESQKKEIEINNNKAKEALEMRQMELDNQKALLDLTEDGFVKERALIDANHKQRLLDIEKQSLELLEKQQEAELKAWEKSGQKGNFTPSSTLNDNNQKIISDMQGIATSQYQNQVSALIKRLGELYLSFDERRRQIDEQYNNDAAALSKTFTGDELRSKLEILNATKKAELDNLNRQEAELVANNSALLVNLFDRVGKMSKKTTLETLQNAQKLLSYLKGESGFNLSFISKEDADKLKESPDEINRIQDAVDNLKQTLEPERKQYLFSGFVDGIKDMKTSQDLLKKAAAATTDEMKESYLAQAELMQKNAMDNIKKGAFDAVNGIQALTDAMMELADASGNEALREKAELFQAMGSNLQAAGQGAQSGGWIGAIVGGVVNMIQQTVQAKAILKAEEKEQENNRLDFLREYDLLLLRVNENQDKVFNSDNTRNIIDAWSKAQDALRKYNEEVNKTTNPTKTEEYSNAGAMVFTGTQWISKTGMGKELSNEYKTQLEAFNKGYTDLQGMAVKTKDRSGWANFWGKQDEFTSLKDLAPELWGTDGQFNIEAAKAFLETNTQITEEQRKQIEGVIALKEGYDEAMAAIDAEIQSTFGSLYNSLGDSLVNAIENGTNAWEDFRSAGYDVLQQLGKKLMMELFFNKKFEALTKQLEDSYGAGDAEQIANAQAAILQSFFSEIQGQMSGAEDFLKQWQTQMGAMGFSNEETQNSLSGAIKGMTEETASILSGYANAIRIQQIESIQVLRSQLIALNKIETNTAKLGGILDALTKIANSDSLRAYGL